MACGHRLLPPLSHIRGPRESWPGRRQASWLSPPSLLQGAPLDLSPPATSTRQGFSGSLSPKLPSPPRPHPTPIAPQTVAL